MKQLLFLFIALICILCKNELSAKDFNLKEFKSKLPEMLGANNIGTDYWLSFNVCYYGVEIGDLYIYISSEFETTVNLEIPGKGYIRQQRTVPNDIIMFELSPVLGQCYRRTGGMHPEPDAVYSGAGVHLYADQPFIVYCVTRFSYCSDSYLALPVSSLGKDYIIASWPDDADNEKQWLPGETNIVSPYDNNKVRFTMGGTTDSKTAGGQLPGETRTYNMMKGDVLAIASLGQRSDLSGSRVHATKPVAVISGSYGAYVPELTPYWDFMTEMELPTYSWGKVYHYTPFFGRLKNMIVRIFTQEAGTTIYRDGTQLATLKTGAGMRDDGWLNMRADVGTPRPITFSADKPIYVMEYNTGNNDDGRVVNTNPFMMVLTPFEQYQKELTFNTPGIKGGAGFTNNYINIVYNETDDGKIPDDLEFATVKSGQFVWQKLSDIDSSSGLAFSVPINEKNYKCKQMRLTGDGVYKLRANEPFTVYAYGNSMDYSYGHPASVALNDFEKPDTLAPNPTWIMECDGTIQDALVEDMPQNNDRSNMSMVIYNPEASYNYKFSYVDFIPGEDAFTHWNAYVFDRTKDARAVITFIDRRGNDTTIVINYLSNFLNIKPDIDFGKLNIGDTVIKEVWGYNGQTHRISSDSITLKFNDKGFELMNAGNPINLESGDSILIQVRFIATKLGEFTDLLGNSACPHQSFYSASVHAIVDTVNSVDDDILKPFYIYPNPADDFIILKNLKTDSYDYIIKIYDIWGIKIFDEKYSSSKNNLQIRTHDFPSGIYYLQIINHGETITRKFCVVR